MGFRWVYFRKKADAGPFDLFSDIDSRIRQLNMMLLIPVFFGILNLWNAVNLTKQYLHNNSITILVFAVLTWVLFILMTYGFISLSGKKKRLKRDRMLFE